MLTELDLTIRDLAEIFYQNRWYPVTSNDDKTVDVEEEIRKVLQSLLREIVKIPEKEEGIVGTMRLFIEKDPTCNMANIRLDIGTVEW